ncbi:MAG: hypothetical protein CM15mP85_30250 [Rhodobacterales bacterium]|nr:MAG: hypothetical protein CM15mP85_30250 [Rhodobacterales bacterium]
MDEGNQFARGHPAIHVLPAILSISSKKNNNYKEFLEAFIIGYDVAARIGLACNLNLNMHPHGTWGGVGAAAALARLLKLDGNDTKELLNIASSLTLATSRKTMLEGGTVRNTYAGHFKPNGLNVSKIIDCRILWRNRWNKICFWISSFK